MNWRNSHIVVLLFCSVSLWLSSCKTKQICPAYQSVFYLDHKLADIEFSPFDKDSMPKIEETVRKTDVLLVLRLGKKKVDKRMAVIPMITIFPEQADSALAMADSLAADSAMVDEEAEEISEENEIQDSTETMEDKPEIDAPKPEEEDAPIEDAPEEKNEIVAPKPKKKTDPKDPELSDPSMKAEFEESFEDAPSDFDLNTPLPEEEAPPAPVETKAKKKKKTPAKAVKKAEPVKKEEEPAAEDDKF